MSLFQSLRFTTSRRTCSLMKNLNRRFQSTATASRKFVNPGTNNVVSNTTKKSNEKMSKLSAFGAFGISMALGQYAFGSAVDFVDESFVTTKNWEDLADFYGTEDFMEIFCVFPFMVQFVMRGAEFDEEGNIHTWGLMGPGEMVVSILFEEREVDTSGDGQPDTTTWFNKKETFSDHAPAWLGGFQLWEMTQNFGYHRFDDGTSVIYHRGEKFNGFFPIRLLFQLHAKYVIWATERYINGENFGSEDREDEMEEQRHNVPLHAFQTFLMSLTRNVERAKADTVPNSEESRKLEGTLRRLKTLSNDVEEGKKNLPRLRTLRSHQTRVGQVQLVLDDKDTKSTIDMAVQQIEESNGQQDAPSMRMKELTRRATLMPRMEK